MMDCKRTRARFNRRTATRGREAGFSMDTVCIIIYKSHHCPGEERKNDKKRSLPQWILAGPSPQNWWLKTSYQFNGPVFHHNRKVKLCECVRRWWHVGGDPARLPERVWARPHVIHKVRAEFGVTVDMKARVANNVFWTRATDSRQFVPVFHNLKCHRFQGQIICKTYKRLCVPQSLLLQLQKHNNFC